MSMASAGHGPPVSAVVIGALLCVAMLAPALLALGQAHKVRRTLRECPRCGARAVRRADHERVTLLKSRVVLQCGQCATWRRVVVDNTDRDVQTRRLARDRRRIR